MRKATRLDRDQRLRVHSAQTEPGVLVAEIMELLLHMLQSGSASLVSYLAAHVLLCLVPAFFVAGA